MGFSQQDYNYDLPFCNIIQAVGADFLNWRIPTEKEHRWLVYTSLAYGARGIVWFHWDHDWGLTASPRRDALYASIRQLNSEIVALGPVLLTLKSVAVYHSDNGLPENGLISSISDNVQILIGLYKDENNADYFMLMNKDYHDSATINVTLKGATDQLECFDVDSNKWKSVTYQNIQNSSEFICALLPGGGKLYKIGTLSFFGTSS